MKKLFYFIPYCFSVLCFAMQWPNVDYRFERISYNNDDYIIFDKVFPKESFTMRAGNDDGLWYVEACLGGYHFLLLEGEDAKNIWETYCDDFYEQEKNKSACKSDLPYLESDNDVVMH